MFSSPFSGIFYFIVLPLLVLFSAVVSEKVPFFRALKSAEPRSTEDNKVKNRHETIDGLRGFLAISVLFQHAVTNYVYYSTGIWKITDIRLYRHAGGEAVILFFMITSFLYWSKAIASKGNIDATRLYRNRFFRLAPMYLVSAIVVTFAILLQTNFHISSILQFFKDIASWLSLGVITTTSVNGYSIIPINAGIHWTLHFEWIFYALLPFSAMVLRGGWYRLFAIPVVLLALLLPGKGYWIIFFFGVLAAHIVHRFPRCDFLKSNWAAWIPLAGIALVYFMQYKPYSVPQYAVSLLVLLCFIYGGSIWGLLKTRAAIFLGTISYSVYLLHGIVLYAVLGIADIYTPIVNLSAVSFWALILLAGLCTILVSAFTYRYIEHPFLTKAAKLSKSDK